MELDKTTILKNNNKYNNDNNVLKTNIFLTVSDILFSFKDGALTHVQTLDLLKS